MRVCSVILGAAVAVMGFVGSAQALSCLKPSVENSFNGWADSPDTYYIGKGTLTPLSPLPRIPDAGSASNGADTSNLRAVYRFDGEMIGLAGNTPISHVVWVRASCAGPWCGGFPSGGTSGILAFKHLPDYTLEASFGPCGGDLFKDRDGSVEAKVRSCMAAGRCPDVVPSRR